MNATDKCIQTTLRIPGKWSRLEELRDRLPTGFRLTSDSLIMPDDTEIDFVPLPPDDAFAHVFKLACRRPATADEMGMIEDYTINVGLIGPGGSMKAALTTMRAGAAIVHAGGAGVFIDNSALAHGGGDWIEMADDGGPDAISFAFVSIVRGRRVWTLGMHIMGLPDVAMRSSPFDPHAEEIVEVIRYLCTRSKPIGNGHLLGDANGPRYQAVATNSSAFDVESPMHNPFGRLKLVSIGDVAEGN